MTWQHWSLREGHLLALGKGAGQPRAKHGAVAAQRGSVTSRDSLCALSILLGVLLCHCPASAHTEAFMFDFCAFKPVSHFPFWLPHMEEIFRFLHSGL